MIDYGDVFYMITGTDDSDLNNGAGSVYYGAPGDIKTNDAEIKENPYGSGVAMRYDARFDDPTYYG